ncbi:uncharacterized protein [Euwallacea similis]|uniref:uncharacterized protein n=1 Tax=Euwallacea similis TaxID=1736056 RepID=UPI00344C6B0E
MSCKLLALVAFCLIFLNVRAADHNLRQCADTSLAKSLICEDDIRISGKFLHQITEIVDCPKYGVQSNKISCIIVTNQLGENGGEVTITDGGINYYNVEIALKSQVSKGLNYHVEVYTDP